MKLLTCFIPKIVKHETCWGINFFRVFSRSVEIWFCPPGYVIKEHSHPNEDVELMFISGKAKFVRRRLIGKADIATGFSDYYQSDSATCVSPEHTFKTFTILSTDSHWFEVSDRWLVFINFAKWKKGIQPTSASVDFKESEQVYAR